MARAPSRAAMTSGTSSLRKPCAAWCGSWLGSPSSRSASGSRPASRGIWALGRRLGLFRTVTCAEPGLGVRGPHLRVELAGQLALGGDLLEDRLPALVELA